MIPFHVTKFQKVEENKIKNFHAIETLILRINTSLFLRSDAFMRKSDSWRKKYM
jgi:hypothetical protein